MGRTPAPALAATGLSAIAVAGLVALVLDRPGTTSLWYAAQLVLSAVPLVLGWLILRHARSLPARGEGARTIGTLLCCMGLVGAVTTLGDAWAASGTAEPGRVLDAWLVTVYEALWVLLYAVPALLVLLFPTGRLPSRRWRPVVGVLVATVPLMVLLSASGPDPLGRPLEGVPRPLAVPAVLVPAHTVASVVCLLAILGVLVAAAASAVVRRRSSDPVERAQLRWNGLAGMSLPAALLLCWASYLLLRGPDLVVVGLALVWVALPTVTWVAVVHHNLYDVDRVRVTVVLATLLTVAALVAWTAATVVVGALVGRHSPVVAAVVATVLVLGLLPLRPWLGRVVGRRLYPRRAALHDAVSSLLREVRAGTAVPEDLDGTLARALGTPGLRVGYLRPGGAARTHEGEVLGTGAGTWPVRLGGRDVAIVTGVAPVDHALLAEVADSVAHVAELVGLRMEATAALREAEESRRRLQAIGYEERRRLERDLHDGAQQRLVSLGMTLRVAQRHLSERDAETYALLDEAVAQLGTAVSELRQLAHGIRPACLDDGLGPALAPLCRSAPVPVQVQVEAGELPDAVATTAYYAVMEAVTNAVKHASASRIAVRVERMGQGLAVVVADDGIGGAEVVALGAGLAGVRDRVRAAGGTFGLRSPAGGGTTLEVLLPCA